ncbi:hypothetical protein K3495_g6784 [Podosphaera aphanis]|nr:hypothetical protein K3495_g6784 [Podosphaera aphanis]
MVESDAPSPTVTERTKALRTAMRELERIRATRQVHDALKTRNGPSTTEIHKLPLNSLVLVWREANSGHLGKWDGPFKLLNVDAETCTINMPSGPTQFRSTSVKPYLTEQDDLETTNTNNEVPTASEMSPSNELTIASETSLKPSPPLESQPQPIIEPSTVSETSPQLIPRQTVLSEVATQSRRPKRNAGKPRRYLTGVNNADITVFLNEEDQFKESRRKEINGLLEKGVFEVVQGCIVPAGTRIFNSRFVDEVKFKGTDKAFEKSRLVVQAYNDHGKDFVLTQSPTIQRVSQRLIVCMASCIPDTNLYLRDISQAYVQSTTKLNRDFYIRPPPELKAELGLEEKVLLKVVKPLYGVPEAGNHWFRTYHNHHTKELFMTQSTFDSCLLRCHKAGLLGILGLQIDDTLFLANDRFANEEQIKLKEAKFPAKERHKLTEDQPLNFNGCTISLDADKNILRLTQEHQCNSLTLISEAVTTSTSSRGAVRSGLTIKDQYVAQRAKGAYIASMCQPEAAFDLPFAAQATNPQKEDVNALNKRLKWQIENKSRGLNFVKLDINTLHLYVFTDASFANNKDFSSQIGYVLVLADSSKRANLIHWSSTKCKRVTRSVLASELYAMVHGFDIGAAVKSTVEQLTQTKIPLTLCTDSRSLYDCLVKLGTTQEKRLMIDLMCLRQSYERREITEVMWIDGNSNPADSMTKSKSSAALQRLIDENKLELGTMEWVERTNDTNDTNTKLNDK